MSKKNKMRELNPSGQVKIRERLGFHFDNIKA